MNSKLNQFEPDEAMAFSEGKESTLSLVFENAKGISGDVYSPIHHINGYPWRLRLYWRAPRTRGGRCVSLICEKSRESTLWQCTATISHNFAFEEVSHTFCSWHKFSHEIFLASGIFDDNFNFTVNIKTKEDGNRWIYRQILAVSEPFDVFFVIGEHEKKAIANKKTLASQSPFFDRLFFGDFKDWGSDDSRIDVDYEEFVNILKIVHGFVGFSIADDNAYNMLNLAERFELKIVEDAVVSHLLSSASYFSIHEKLLIADQYRLTFLRDTLLSWYTPSSMEELNDSTEIQYLSIDTLQAVFRTYCDLNTETVNN